VRPLWEKVFNGANIPMVSSIEECRHSKVVEYAEYDDLDFDRLAAADGTYFGCSYIYRKGLIRKHYLANTIRMFTVKNPNSVLISAFPETFNIEVDYAEFLDDALDEAYELRMEIEQSTKTWILKPSMSDRGQGVRLFNSIPELQEIFDEFDEGVHSDDEDDPDDHGVITSQLRHFVVQEYIANPLILPMYGNRKFHIRTYVIAVGAIKVYVYRDMLALFALSEYQRPSEDGPIDLKGHLTNTCLQGEFKDEGSVRRFWDLETDSQDSIWRQICEITGDLFKAAVTVDRINFQPLPNAFEIYGLDFLVSEDEQVHLLEVNAYPDFKQTGDNLNQVIVGLFRAVVAVAVSRFQGAQEIHDENAELVLDVDVSGAW
jgi:tubulin--tyrosine ligase